MSEDQIERLLALLSRIAVAVEFIAHPTQTMYGQSYTQPGTATGSGWTCQICHGFVPYGQGHSCAGWRP